MSIFIKNQVNSVVFKYTFRFYTIENTIFIMKNRYHGVSIYRKNKYIHAIYGVRVRLGLGLGFGLGY